MRIFLIGFMGSGKSFLGELWAEDNNIPFFDLDILIEEEERMSVEKIFAGYGEDYFREKEAAVLRNTDRFENAIIACGGGTPCYFDNMQWMNKNGMTVFLDENPQQIFHHIINDKKVRPLIASQSQTTLQTFINNKLLERRRFYEQCRLILKPEQLNRNGFSIIQKLL